MKVQDCMKILEEIRTLIENDIKVSNEQTRIWLHYSMWTIWQAIARISEAMNKEQWEWYLLWKKLCSWMNLRYWDWTIIENIHCTPLRISWNILNWKWSFFLIARQKQWEKFIEEKWITF